MQRVVQVEQPDARHGAPRRCALRRLATALAQAAPERWRRRARAARRCGPAARGFPRRPRKSAPASYALRADERVPPICFRSRSACTAPRRRAAATPRRGLGQGRGQAPAQGRCGAGRHDARLAVRSTGGIDQWLRIMVPTPWSVMISSSRQWSTRPSTMCTEFTPALAASSADEIFGSMPPEIVPSANRSSIWRAREPGQQIAALVEHPGRVGEQHQLLGLEHLGNLAGDDVGIDVVGLALFAGADRRDHRDEAVRGQGLDDAGVDLLDLADLADVDLLLRLVLRRDLHAPGADQAAVLSGESDCAPAGVVDQFDDFLVDLAGEHHLDDVHGLGVGHAHALHELALLADAREQLLDLRTATVHDHRIQPDQLQQHDVAREALLETFVGHRVAAVLHDDDLAVEATDVGHRLGEDRRLQRRRHGGRGWRFGRTRRGTGGLLLGAHAAPRADRWTRRGIQPTAPGRRTAHGRRLVRIGHGLRPRPGHPAGIDR